MWFHHYLHKHDLSSTIDLFHTGLTQNMNNGFVPFKCPVSRDGVNNSTELKQRSIVDSLLCCSSCDGSACLPRWRLVRLHACPTSTDFIPFQMNSENQSDRFQRLPADVSTLEDRSVLNAPFPLCSLSLINCPSSLPVRCSSATTRPRPRSRR